MVVQAGSTTVMVDCGFSLRETEQRLGRLGIGARDLSAVLVTHEHADHSQGVRVLANRYELPVFMTAGTARAGHLAEVRRPVIISGHQSFCINELHIQPVAVPHDAAEPVQFVFDLAGKRLGVLTDLGSITPHVRHHYRTCDALVLESNHCSDMLARGPYPPSLKVRVGGQFGHLNNDQAASLLREVELERLQHLVIAHLSEKNNTIERAQAVLAGAMAGVRNVLYACQEKGFGWLTIY